MMKKLTGVFLLVLMCALTAGAAKKESGTTTLKDVQPAGTFGNEGKKNKKTKQQYDFIFEASGKHYTCRTSEKTSVNATDFVVGSSATYQIDGQKGTLKTDAGKQMKCTIVRVENVSASPAK
jgi:curli biogenesis system outer membrane secretion channel CsgG